LLTYKNIFLPGSLFITTDIYLFPIFCLKNKPGYSVKFSEGLVFLGDIDNTNLSKIYQLLQRLCFKKLFADEFCYQQYL